MKQETVSGSGISWATCKSAPRSRQITTPAPQHSVFTGRVPFLPPNQQCQSTSIVMERNCVTVTVCIRRTSPPLLHYPRRITERTACCRHPCLQRCCVPSTKPKLPKYRTVTVGRYSRATCTETLGAKFGLESCTGMGITVFLGNRGYSAVMGTEFTVIPWERGDLLR